jgi:hypothetical protein
VSLYSGITAQSNLSEKYENHNVALKKQLGTDNFFVTSLNVFLLKRYRLLCQAAPQFRKSFALGFVA